MTAVRSRWRRAAVVVGVGALAGLTVLTPVSLAASGDESSVTVDAPQASAPGSTTTAQVTVNQTADIVNQTVHVSWTGFKPSNNLVVTPGNTQYVVRVYQCRGDAPASPADCYGSKLYTYPGQTDETAVLPDGPGNARDAATAPDGTGSVDIEIRTILESSTLGCTSTTACSVVVVPNYGNGKRSQDFINATTDQMDQAWAWERHVAVPLHLSTVGAICPLGVPGVVTVGSPMLQRAVTSWQPAACQAEHPVNADYTALGEPQARDDYVAGNADLGLTTLPAASVRPTVYAPVSVSGVTVAFHVDDADTGQPIVDMKLNARLVAKLITESYGGVGVVKPGEEVGTGNPATKFNPYSIYTDPEFLELNPGHAWPRFNPTNPLLLAGNSDLTWELTRWIDDDPTARAWLDGADDGHGMHVNTNFKGIDYPVTSLETKDPYPALTYTFVPVNGLDHVARGLVADQPSSSNPDADPITGQHPKDPQQLPGKRALLAIIDTADATAFNAPEAALLNAGGDFVAPTTDSLGAAVAHLKMDSATKTGLADHTSTDPAAYPLTMVHYAMAPTGDLTLEHADQVARVLDYAAGPGQVPGAHTGELPGGYLPLPTDLLNQLTAAAAAVRSQADTPAKETTPETPTDTTVPPDDTGYSDGQVGGSVDDAPADGSDPAALANAAAAKASASAAAAVQNVAASGPVGSGLRIWWPIALIVTAVAGAIGPLLIAHGRGAFRHLTAPRYSGRRSA